MAASEKEFYTLRDMLDEAGIPWHDASDEGLMLRTHGEGFSVIYGFGSYGYEAGLLEIMTGGGEPVGFLTAQEVFETIRLVCKTLDAAKDFIDRHHEVM